MTSALRSFNCTRVGDNDPLARSVRLTSCFAARMAGTRPKTSAVSALTVTANPSTEASIRMASILGTLEGFTYLSTQTPA